MEKIETTKCSTDRRLDGLRRVDISWYCILALVSVAEVGFLFLGCVFFFLFFLWHQVADILSSTPTVIQIGSRARAPCLRVVSASIK